MVKTEKKPKGKVRVAVFEIVLTRDQREQIERLAKVLAYSGNMFFQKWMTTIDLNKALHQWVAGMPSPAGQML